MTSGYFEKHALIQSNGLWGRSLYYYGTDGIEYICRHIEKGTASSAGGWYIWKYIYSSGNLEDVQGPLRGTADGRAALGWV